MAKNNQRILTILGAVIGSGLTAFGIRRGIQWYQQRQSANRFTTQYADRSWPAERRYQPVDQPDRAPIPATGPQTMAPPMTEAERVNSDRVSDFDDRGTAFSTSELDKDSTPVNDDITVATTEFNKTGDRQTGMGGGTGQPQNMGQQASTQSSDVVMDDFVAPLIEHAIAFNSVMNLLRSRQRDGQGFEGTESLTEGDRNSMRAVLDQMQELKGDYNEADFRGNSLAQRSYNLTRKLHDALENMNYTGSDLYRINGEVTTEICSLARDLDKSGQVTITGLDHLRQLYECK